MTTHANPWADPATFVTRPADAAAVLSALELPRIDRYLQALSEAGGVDLPALRRLSENTLVAMSGEAHLRTRRAIAPFFSRAGLQRWSAPIDEAIDRAMARLAAADEPDLVADFTVPLFMQVMPSVLGLPLGDRSELFDAVVTVQRITEPYLSVPTLRRLDRAVALLIDTATPPDDARDAAHPASLLSELRARRAELPDGLDPRYLCLGLLVGANSATQSLAFALYGLLMGPAAQWRDAAGEGWAERELPRMLSLYPSTRTLVRNAPEATEVAGCPYAAGQTAVVDIVAANACLRHEAQPGRPHLSFGSGAHKCPGSFLSEQLFARAIPALARRFPALRLHVDRCAFVQTPMMQAPLRLPCETGGETRRLSARLCEVRDMPRAREVVRDDARFVPPQMAEHLAALATASGRNFDSAIRIARHALFFMDGERHQQLRRPIAERLGPRALRDWHAPIDAVIHRALDALAGAPQPDLVAGYADRLRREAVAPLLGVVPSDPARFAALAPGLQDVLQPWLRLRDLERVQATFAEALSLMTVPDVPGEPSSLLAGLLADAPPGCSTEDLKATVLVLYGASFNLSHTLANILYRILSGPPEQRQGAGDPAWIDASLEDLIAICASPRYIYRMAREDLSLGALAIHRGDTVRLSLAPMHRTRAEGERHLAFGHGLHHCAGAALSRWVIRRAVPALFTRFPQLTLTAHGQVHAAMTQTVALQALPVRLARSSTTAP